MVRTLLAIAAFTGITLAVPFDNEPRQIISTTVRPTTFFPSGPVATVIPSGSGVVTTVFPSGPAPTGIASSSGVVTTVFPSGPVGCGGGVIPGGTASGIVNIPGGTASGAVASFSFQPTVCPILSTTVAPTTVTISPTIVTISGPVVCGGTTYVPAPTGIASSSGVVTIIPSGPVPTTVTASSGPVDCGGGIIPGGTSTVVLDRRHGSTATLTSSRACPIISTTVPITTINGPFSSSRASPTTFNGPSSSLAVPTAVAGF